VVGLDEIETEVRDACSIRCRDLGRPDIEPAEDLARVGRDHRGGPASAAHRFTEPDRQLGLARGGRAGQDDERWGRRHAADERASQRVRAGVVDADRHGSPDEHLVTGQMDELVASAPAGEAAPLPRHRCGRRLVVVFPRGVDGVDQDLDLAADPGFIPFEPDRLLDRQEGVEAAAFDIRRHVVGEPRRRRPRPRRIRRREDLVVADGLEQRQGRLELGLGLAAETHDDVGRDRDPRDGLADPGQAFLVVLDRVLAAHPVQDGV